MRFLKFQIIRPLCMAVLCTGLLFSGVRAENNKPVKMAGFPYPPFYDVKNDKIEGVAVEWIQELFGRLGLKTELALYPLKRSLSYMESGEGDAIMVLIKTPEREKLMVYTEPLLTVRGLIWSAANRNGGPVEYKTPEDLKDYRIGVTRGYSYGEEFDRFLAKASYVDISNSDISNYQKLAAGRIDVFPGNEIVARSLFMQHSDLHGKIIASRKAFIEWELHMGISRKSELVKRLPEINRIINEMRDSGFIKQTVQKYTE